MGSYLLSVLVVLVITPRIPGFISWVVDLEVLGPSSWILDRGSQVLGPGSQVLGSQVPSPGVLGPRVLVLQSQVLGFWVLRSGGPGSPF